MCIIYRRRRASVISFFLPALPGKRDLQIRMKEQYNITTSLKADFMTKGQMKRRDAGKMHRNDMNDRGKVWISRSLFMNTGRT
jgi:hypothetical protein